MTEQQSAENAAEPAEATEQGEPTVADLQRELEQARAEAQGHFERLMRSQAEMENLRKRSARDLEQAHKYGIEKLVAELLPVKDSLEMGLAAATETVDPEKLREGMELTLKMLGQALEKFEVSEVDPLEQPFDPQHHQAMSMVEHAQHPPNTVLSVMQKGYLLSDRLLRPAMVVVTKEPSSN